ncbi:MAG: asparagine synthase (glutamine-hydrolyzing), partial [Tepidiformaceae bacterium]
VIDPARRTARTVVGRMNELLRHRGPDDVGEEEQGGVTLAMRRLAVLDLDTGRQPIANETGDVRVIFNGEIYNHRELRDRLARRGHRLSTRSDTEVLVHLYEDQGDEFVKDLRGMFAFALHDLRRGRVLFARDRFGEKPLFYYARPDLLVFSSELRSLLAHPEVPRILDPEGLRYYLKVGFISAPLTMLRDIHSLPPGHVMTADVHGARRVRPYYELDFTPDPDLGDAGRAARAVRDALFRAVGEQLVADVPVGGFLSGGIDSGSVMAAASALRAEPIESFTVRFATTGYDEGKIAAAVAARLGTRHRVEQVRNAEFLEEDFWRIVDHVGQPFFDSSAMPTGMIAAHARRHVTVCLSGDGGDEMFAGYPVLEWGHRVRRAGRLPAPVLALGAGVLRLAGRLPWAGPLAALRQIARGLEAARLPEACQFVAIHELFDATEVVHLSAREAGASLVLPPENLLTEVEEHAPRWTPLRRMMAWRIRHCLEADMLVKVDRMSMAHSLEVRAPFLDPGLADLAARLPDHLLLRGSVGKQILRRAMVDLLPAAVFDHPKQGFSIPLHEFQNDSYRALSRDLLLAPHPLHALFRREALEDLLDYGTAQRADTFRRSVYRSSHQLWAMVQLFGWARRFGIRLP